LSIAAWEVPRIKWNQNIKVLFRESQLFKGQNKLHLLYRVWRGSSILFGGGSVFQSFDSIRYFNTLLTCATGHNYALGVSIGPFYTVKAESACRELMKKFTVICTRDDRSYEMLKSYNIDAQIINGGDLAVLLFQSEQVAREQLIAQPKANKLGLALCNYERFINGDCVREAERINKIVQSLEMLDPSNIEEIVLFDFNGHDKYGDNILNRSLARLLQKKYRVTHIPYDSSPISVLKQIAEMRCLIAMRLHAAVFGFMANVPTIIMAYHQKCIDWARLIKSDAGLLLDEHTYSAETLADTITRIMRGEQQANLERFEVIEQRAMKNWTW
jgi:polysaccharide pyruvyl transferase WcaK-like protein